MRVISYSARGKYFILLASSFMFPISAFAQCVDTQDCQTLGYTETSNSGNCVKCPFGDYWSCPKHEEEKAVLGQCTGYAKNCSVGQILNADGTCTSDKVSGKTPVAVVAYIGSDNCGQALALEGIGYASWSTEYVDIPDLPNYGSSNLVNDFDSCENTKIVIDYSSKQYGDGAYKYYPAFGLVYKYAPSTMPETKGEWCLPAVGVLNSIYQNKTTIDQSLTRISMESIGDNEWWTSSEHSNNYAWDWDASSGKVGYYIKHDNAGRYVRPVIEF